ncbi:MAG: NAD-dependent epimerase/dehydratase family protein, partial [Bryobacteraceae bacterium]
MVHLVTGGAGFIASHLVTALLLRGHEVVALDNLALGDTRHLNVALASGRCRFMQIDCAELTEF